MATDDPRLNLLIKEGGQGDIVIVGCPYDLLRKRVLNKGGEDNGPCCLRRFYAKVGPLVNAQYQIDISSLRVSDLGNVVLQISKQEEEQKFKNVTSRRFKGDFVNYYKQSPEMIIEHISDRLSSLVGNNQLPFVFGGSKQGLMACVHSFQQVACTDKTVYILSGKPFLERPYDGNKATSDNICSVLNLQYPQQKFKVFGVHQKYFPSDYITKGDKIQTNTQKLPNFEFTTFQQIRATAVDKSSLKLGRRTQGKHKFERIYNSSAPAQVNISLQVLQVFRGCRDLCVEGLAYDQFMEIMLFLGGQANLKSISINEFNPSCQDYESSLLILNALYYFLMGRAASQAST